MTYLIDISGHQAALDIELIKPDNEAVIVKAVAAYRPEHTVADGYHDNIDRVVAAGLPKGHYLVPNSRNTPKESAAFFAANLYGVAPGDVFMLDNEPLDGYPVFWRDDEVMEFFEEFHRLTGVPWSQLWLYCPAHATRQGGPWTRVEEARKTDGLRIVWVSYGDNDPFREDGEEPLLGGGITGWDVHQFTSTYRVAGYAGNLDRNYTPHPIEYLFPGDNEGDATMTLEDKARAFAARYPTSRSHPSGGDNDWDQDCGRLCYRFAAWLGWATRPNEGQVYSAYAVAMASGRLNLNAAAAPVGAWHFWDIGGPGNGHVGVDLTGGGRRVFMGTWSVAEDWGRAVGVLSVGGYTAAKAGRARYLGWATNYAGGTVNLSGLAGLGTTPIDNNTPAKPIDLGDIMARYLWAQNRGGILITETDGVFFPSMAGTNEALAWEYRAAQKLLFNGIDVDTRVWDVARQDALDRQSAAGKRTDDKITEAINAAIDAKLTGDITVDADVEIDVEAIATSVREKFRTDPLS